MNKLMRVASHPSLIQGVRNKRDKKNELVAQFASEALPDDLLHDLGGPWQEGDFLTVSNPSKSGKMMTLKSLLERFVAMREKVLVFSYSTRVLDLIEKLVKGSGWSSVRLDGDTLTNSRQSVIDSFNKSPSLYIFLLSTRAGGIGINLVSASKVIQFDVCWNPTMDHQVDNYQLFIDILFLFDW